MDDDYAGICGITKEELLSQMKEDIDILADKLCLSHEQTVAKLKENYDGYHFAWPSSDIFNPYSLLTCFAKQKLDSYWFGSGTPTYLLNMMRKFGFTPINLGEPIEVGKDDFDAATETMTTIMPLLYQSGYVTIKGYDPETELYTLGLPNKEVRIGLFRSLLPHYLATSTAMGNTTIAKMSVMIKRGQIDDALALFNTFLSTVPYCDNTHYEGHYQQLMYIVFALLTNFRILVEQHTAKGRTDITMETDTELERIRNFVNTAIAIKEGREIHPYDAKAPEMRQNLSLAGKYFFQGESLLKEGKRNEAEKYLNMASEKINQVKIC